MIGDNCVMTTCFPHRLPRLLLRAWIACFVVIAIAAPALAQPLPDLGGRKVVAATENAFPPLNMLEVKTGQGVGWEYDAWNEIARRLNLKVEWRVSSWDAMIQSVRDGQFDVAMNGITINAQRKALVDFSQPYMRSELFMLVRAGETRFTDPTSFRANPKWLVGAQPGTTSFYATARELLAGPQVNPRIKLFDTFGATVQALKASDVDVVLSDATAAKGYLSRYPGSFKLIGPALAGEDYGFVFRQGSPLVAPVNAALRAMAADGSIARLNEKWFGPAK